MHTLCCMDKKSNSCYNDYSHITKGRVNLQMSRTIKAGHVYRQYSRDGMFIAGRKTGGGYLWRVVPENTPEDPISVDLTSRIGYHDKRPLIQMTLDGEPVAEFISIAHASRSLGISRRSLSCALTGAQKTAGGFIWKEKESEENK